MPQWLDDLLWAYGSFVYGLGVNAILGLSMYAVLALGQLSLLIDGGDFCRESRRSRRSKRVIIMPKNVAG